MVTTLFWFRRDLRLQDNAGLYRALKNNKNVIPIFIFDKNILDDLEDKKDRRVAFIHQTITKLDADLQKLGTSLLVKYGEPLEVISKLISEYNVIDIYTNHDYEPYAKQRDEKINTLLAKKNGKLITFKDQVIFEKAEVVKDDGLPYTVFTPFSRKWKAKVNDYFLKEYPTEKYFKNFSTAQNGNQIPSLASMNFMEVEDVFPNRIADNSIIKNYHETRDYPSVNGTTKMSIHLRFGTVSIRALANQAAAGNEKFLNELIWRDFYQQILWHFPHVVNGSFRPVYDAIPWRNNIAEFDAWCEGKTGYPIVDAGMRELNTTGWMHNRVRMVVASFLTKHLLIDWRWGEAYFAKKLNDFDLASNNGGWQWAAGCGVDAAPYFRIFNPRLQTEKFDKQLKYINFWIPELNEFTYPKPIVDHDTARKRCLEVYKIGLGKE
jgi:deoxyribodipyrimidine photo-lyase